MRVILQRVSQAAVKVNQETIASIKHGLLLLVGVGREDTEADAVRLAGKITRLRIFEDAAGKMNLSLSDVGGNILAVSQFTLFGNTSKGRRPSFTEAAPPKIAEPLFTAFVSELKKDAPVKTGLFGANMSVELINDGPVTLILEST
jgi:D-tyrosyl-tRNA(Tyr) deacylase